MRDTITVYVVILGNKGLRMSVPSSKVGAVYATEEEAQAEVKRLLSANRHTHAAYVDRQLELDNCPQID